MFITIVQYGLIFFSELELDVRDKHFWLSDLVDFLCVSLSDDLADDLGDVDFEDTGNAGDDEGWETEDEMEADAEQDDSELTFSKHTGINILPWF